MEKVSLFGVGFVLGNYANAYKDDIYAIPSTHIMSKTRRILYARSTIHNYHPKEGNPYIDIDTNLTHFMKVLDANRIYYGKDLELNFISSWFVLGSSEIPAKETSVCRPTGFYSITKYAAELLLQSYAETFGIKFRILRLGNVIGAGDTKISRQKNSLQFIIQELAQGRDVDYLYSGGAIRDYIDVRDCVRAIHLVLEKGELNSIYNIANGQGLNVNDLVYTAWQESGYKAIIGEIPTPDFHKIVQTPKMYLDIKKLKSLGYVQQHDIKQSVRELTHYYETQQDT